MGQAQITQIFLPVRVRICLRATHRQAQTGGSYWVKFPEANFGAVNLK